MDNVDLKDPVYGNNVDGTNSVVSNRLQTKERTFAEIKDVWDNYREELSNAKNSLVSEEYSFSSGPEIGKSINNMEAKIARIVDLEVEIKELAEENVSFDFRESRAIKLRNQMFENFMVNSQGLHFVPEDKKDLIFDEDEEPVKNDFFPGDIVQDNFNNEKDSVDLKEVVEEEKESIKNDIDEAMDKEKEVELFASAPSDETAEDIQKDIDNVIGLDDVKSVIDEQLQNTNPVEDTIQNNDEISQDDVSDVIGDMMKDINPVVEETVQEEKKPRQRYDYKAMTDEEIKSAQEKLDETPLYNSNDVDKTTNLPGDFKNVFIPVVDSEEPLREVPVVAPERDVEKDLDYSKVTLSDIDNMLNDENITSDKLKQALEEVMAMKEQLQVREKEEDEAKLAADEAEEKRKVVVKRSEEVEGARLESDKLLQSQIEETRRQLQMRMDAVDQNIEFENDRRQTALNEIKTSESSIEENEAKIEENKKIQERLNNVVGSGTVSIRRR